VRHRSVYQLKEADPHMWAVPRLTGRAKTALMEIQVDEYGSGDPTQMHSELFRVLLHELGLDDSYGAYVDEVPGITLAIGNVMSLFGLRRELRGALVGHLAAYEMTSSAPCRRYARGLRRLGASEAACAFYDVHVAADALHEQIAAHDMCGGLAAAEPALTEDIVFGAAVCLRLDGRFAEHVLESWRSGESSLSVPADRLAVAS
jgi:heme oxygenase-like protein